MHKKRLVIIILNSIFIILIFILLNKIKHITNERIKGVQYVTNLKDKVEFTQKDNNLKYFYEPKSNSTQIWNLKWLKYETAATINSDSLNERFEYTNNKRNNILRIITLGDSFTFGVYVDTKDNYPEVLEDMLNNNLSCTGVDNFEVINLGVYGYDVEYSVERFIKRGKKYNPDLVIWLLHDTPFDKINEYYFSYKKSLLVSGIPEFEYDSDGEPIPIAYRKAREAMKNNFSKEEILNYQRKALSRLLEFYRGKLLIISFPSLKKEYNLLITELAEADPTKISFFNKIVDIYQDKSYQLPDSHPNKEGHREIAKYLFGYLRKKHFNECKMMPDAF